MTTSETLAARESDMRQMTGRGRAIEDESFTIIDREVGEHGLAAPEWQVVRRVIHATADFEFRDLMALSPGAVTSGIEALRRGCPIVVDVKMIAVGLSAERLAAHGSTLHCFISDDDVIATAKRRDSTRAIEAIRKAHRAGLLDGAIVAIGNAPTALLELLRLAHEEGARPALVVGVPVGFVSAAESKAALIESHLPFIASRGRKGGSTIAVAIVHALLYLLANPPAGEGTP
jgi:precorrin-8X/cobalt-precorrin-8 methylmutase